MDYTVIYCNFSKKDTTHSQVGLFHTCGDHVGVQVVRLAVVEAEEKESLSVKFVVIGWDL